MGKKTEESRVSYNQMAFDYDTSIEGRYTAFHIEELVNTVLLKENDRVLEMIIPRLIQFNDFKRIAA